MNTSTLQTYSGLIIAAGAGAIDFFAHNSMEGGATSQPTFWIALAIAVLYAIKSYYAQGTAAAGQVTATVPVGTVAKIETAPVGAMPGASPSSATAPPKV